MRNSPLINKQNYNTTSIDMSIEAALEKLTAAIEANTAAIAANTAAGGAFLSAVTPAATTPAPEPAKPAKAKKDKPAPAAEEPAPEPKPAEPEPPTPAPEPAAEEPTEDAKAKRAALSEFLRESIVNAEDPDAVKKMLLEVGSEQFGVKGTKELKDDQLDAFRAAVAAKL